MLLISEFELQEDPTQDHSNKPLLNLDDNKGVLEHK